MADPETPVTERHHFERASGQWERLGTHPNVVTVRARGGTPRPWLAVDAVDGERLGAVGPALSTAAVRSVVADAAEWLNHAARAGLHHGGLSPDGVWVCRGDAGVDGRIDWNVERACRVAAGEAPTSPYTAPEQAEAPAAPTLAADVYALGAVTYAAVTGSQPPGPSAGEPFEWTVHAVDGQSWSERWRLDIEGGIVGTPAVVDDTVYVSAETVRALATADGTERWSQAFRTVPTAPAVADGTVYVADSRRHVVALDAATGGERWQHGAADEFLGSPVAANDTLYIVGRDHPLHGLADPGTE